MNQMDKKSTTFGLSPEKLADLLKICSDSTQSEDENRVDITQKKTELLQDRLAETLPFELSKKSLSKEVLDRLSQIRALVIGEPIRNLLNNPETGIGLIKQIKDYSKRLSRNAASEAEHDTANAIYYAAIASALVFHDIKISKYSYKSLHESFSKLINEEWIPKEITQMFVRTCELCQQNIRCE
jgi:hypothetical protein